MRHCLTHGSLKQMYTSCLLDRASRDLVSSSLHQHTYNVSVSCAGLTISSVSDQSTVHRVGHNNTYLLRTWESAICLIIFRQLRLQVTASNLSAQMKY